MSDQDIRHRSQGALEALGGRIKRAFGALMGHHDTEAKGRAQELKGKMEKEGGAAVDRGEGALQEGAAAAKRAVGNVVGNEKWQAEGRAAEIEGRERREVNR